MRERSLENSQLQHVTFGKVGYLREWQVMGLWTSPKAVILHSLIRCLHAVYVKYLIIK